MKIKPWAAVTLIAVFGACLFIIAGALRESAASDTATYPINSDNGSAVTMSVSSPPAVEAGSVATTGAAADSAAMPVNQPMPNASGGGISEPRGSVSEPVPTSAASTSSAVPNALGAALSTTGAPEKGREVSIPVLNYHSIGVEPDNTLVLDPDKFARQMEYLSKEGYTPLSMSDFTLILEKRKTAPAKPVLLTFDDGYSDNYEQALPVLKRYGFHATLFMSPGTVGQDGYLNWEQVKEMHEAAWDIEPHGMTHPHLPQLSAAKQKEEITEARRQIEEHIGTTADIFCYPYGEFNAHTLTILKEEGFRYAFTIRQGRTTSSQPPLQLRRIYVNGKDSVSAWSKKLSAS